MASALHLRRNDDAELARRVAAGDRAAFALLDARHRRALTRYAGGLLRRSEHDAEDVVQDVLIRAHDALCRGEGPDELRPWLFRLTRNRAIDEVRRARWGDEALDGDAVFAASDDREDPEVVLRRKETMRRLVEDLADLPVRQRVALLARELDDQSPEQVAAELGVSVVAAHQLASRARENLIRTRAARDAACPDVRAVLLDARERGVRPSEHALRHVGGCGPCRAYRRDIRRLSKQLHALNPVWGVPLLAGVAQLAGGGTKVAVGAALAVAVAATGGIVVLTSDVHEAGDPAPFRLMALRDSQGRVVTRGKPIPEGFTVVTARIRLPAGPSTLPKDPRGPFPTVTLPCPEGMKLGSLQLPMGELPLRALGYAKGSIPGYSTGATIKIGHRGLKRAFDFTIGIDCRRPDRYGSISTDNRRLAAALKRGERRLGRACPASEGVHLRDAPGGRTQDYIWRGAPLAIQRRSRSGTWTLVVPDGPFAKAGWLRTGELCP